MLLLPIVIGQIYQKEQIGALNILMVLGVLGGCAMISSGVNTTTTTTTTTNGTAAGVSISGGCVMISSGVNTTTTTTTNGTAAAGVNISGGCVMISSGVNTTTTPTTTTTNGTAASVNSSGTGTGITITNGSMRGDDAGAHVVETTVGYLAYLSLAGVAIVWAVTTTIVTFASKELPPT
jgi:hypothetical protein